MTDPCTRGGLQIDNRSPSRATSLPGCAAAGLPEGVTHIQDLPFAAQAGQLKRIKAAVCNRTGPTYLVLCPHRCQVAVDVHDRVADRLVEWRLIRVGCRLHEVRAAQHEHSRS